MSMVALIKCEHGAYGYGFVCEKCKKSWEAHIRQEERDAIVEVVERMDEQNEITQAILGALEYRGFSDLGKYLDGDIWEGVKPIIITHLQTSNKTV